MSLKNKKIHFIGIKGIGISALAQFSQAAGAKVTGSDSPEKFPADDILRRLKIPVASFSPKNINSKLDLIIYSSAYKQNHPEIARAISLGIPLKTYGQALAEVFNQGKNKILIVGSHGKTTTAALVGHLLVVAGFQPTVFVGGVVNNWQSNFKSGKNEWLVAEGDEYQKKFLFLQPDYLLITNIDYDHPDFFKNKKEYQAAFEDLKKQTRRKVFSGEKIPISFRKFLAQIKFPLLGEKNKENAYLVYCLAKELKISDKKIKIALETFQGIKRRLETIKESAKLKIFDDYAHHPAQIKATLAALKETYPDYKILAIFQPHTFSRTKALLKDFGRCFQKADWIYLLPTFASAREQKPEENIDQILLKEIKKHHPQVHFFSKFNLMTCDVIRLIIVTLGAGDVYKIAEKLAAKLAK